MRRAVFATTLVIALAIALASPARGGLNFTGFVLRSDEVYHPGPLTTDDASNLYVLNNSPFEVIKITTNAQGAAFNGSQSRFGSDRLHNPVGIAFGNDTIYVADLDNRVVMYSPTGTFLGTFGEPGSGNGQFDFPTSVAVDPLGFVYVVDARNERVQKFTPDGEYVSQFGSEGTGDGKFAPAAAAGIAIDDEGNIYVSDESLSRIQKFSSTGAFLAKWGTAGTGLGNLSYPDEMAIDKDGNVMVVESGNIMRVQVFSPQGEPLRTFTGTGDKNSQFQSPHGIAVSDKGRVFVASSGESIVYEFKDAEPGFEVNLGRPRASQVEQRKSLDYSIDYNQDFETCTGSGAGRVTLPNDSFSIDRKDIKLPKGKPVEVRVSLTASEAEKTADAMRRTGRGVEVRMTFKFNCSDNTDHTVRDEARI